MASRGKIPSTSNVIPVITLTPVRMFSFSSFTRALRMFALSVFMLNILAVPAALAVGVDSDSDGLFDEDEAALGMDSTLADTDVDGTLDGDEDNDADTLTNAQELYVYLTEAATADTDADSRDDGAEVAEGTDPLVVELPDFEFQTFELDPADNTIAITIFNVGNYAYTGSVSPTLSLYTADDGLLVESIDLDTMGTGYRSISGSTSFNSTYALDGSVVGVNILAVVDSMGDVYEKTEHPDFFVDEANYVRTAIRLDIPDLYVSDLSLSSSNEVIYTVKNIGGDSIDAALAGENTVTVDGVLASTETWTSMSDLSWLSADAFATEPAVNLTSAAVLSSGSHTVIVCVDTTSLVTEFDDTVNNCFTETLDGGAAATADMDITDISVDSSTNEVLYTAANLGTLDVDYTLEMGYTGVYVDYDETDGSYTDFYYYDWNTEMAAGSWAGTFFDAGGSEVINSEVVLSTGEHTIMVCIERAALYGEFAYGLDNCEIETFNVGIYPDLVIDSVTYNSDTSISFVVRNGGTADVDSAEFPYLNFYYDFFNADLSESYSASYLIDDHGMDYRTVGGITTVNSGASEDEFPSCTLYVLAIADGNGDVVESDDSNNEYRTTLDLCPGDGEVVNGFTVEAGIEEGIGFGNTYNLAAYTEGASSLTSATVDWGDGSAVESTTQTVDGDRINLGASHLYGSKDSFTLTICANDGSETVCDTVLIHIVGNSSSSSSSGGSSSSSSVTLAGDDDEEDTTDTVTDTTTGGTDESTDGTDSSTDGDEQDVVLSGEDDAADCSAMMFEDVSEDDDFYDAVCELWAADVIHGKTTTLFDVNDVIRRDEAAKIFTRLFGYVIEPYGETPSVEESSFIDVEASDPLAYYVEVAATEEIMEPDTDSVENEDGEVVDESTFRPHDAMTASEIADSLETILGDNEAGETLDAEGYEVDSTMTRGGFMNFLFGLVD